MNDLLKFLSVEQAGDNFVVYWHGKDLSLIATLKTVSLAAKFIREFADERL